MLSLRFPSFAHLFQHLAEAAHRFARSVRTAEHAPQQSLLVRLD